MADDVVIRAEGLGKKYIIGAKAEGERYTAVRDVMARNARNLWRRTTDLARGRSIVTGDKTEEFWALKGVSFEVKRGEVLGIIGRNGAGKSTLLKILSRISEPSEGRVTLSGRVASLLEVGTGFHPELTGGENIYLNGAILGMTRAEIRKKFDEIVAFAEVERFLETPVKRYSSGMYVRLAFSVAAHLEPEILIVDEVLAVGDAEFQKKCLAKVSTLSSQNGRTVLFVTHNMSAALVLCENCIHLRNGQLHDVGTPATIIPRYLSGLLPPPSLSRGLDTEPRTHERGRKLRLTSVSVTMVGDPRPTHLTFTISAQTKIDLHNVSFGIGINALGGQRLLTTESPVEKLKFVPKGSRIDLCVEILKLELYPARYTVSLGANSNLDYGIDYIENAMTIDITNTEADVSLLRDRPNRGIRPEANWQVLFARPPSPELAELDGAR